MILQQILALQKFIQVTEIVAVALHFPQLVPEMLPRKG